MSSLYWKKERKEETSVVVVDDAKDILIGSHMLGVVRFASLLFPSLLICAIFFSLSIELWRLKVPRRKKDATRSGGDRIVTKKRTRRTRRRRRKTNLTASVDPIQFDKQKEKATEVKGKKIK